MTLTNVRIEPNPFKSKKRLRIKHVQAVTGGAVNSSKVTYEAPQNISRVPGTLTILTPGLLPNHKINTGLAELVENPYKDGDQGSGTWMYEWGERILKGKDRVLRQHVLEYKHGKPYGFYTDSVRLDVNKSIDEDRTFFERPESRLRLTDNIFVLDFSNPVHEIYFYMAKAHPEVANSYTELEEDPYRYNWFISSDTDNREDAKTEKLIQSTAASAALNELFTKTDDGLELVAKALDIQDAHNLSDKARFAALFAYTNESDDTHKRFMHMYEQWKDVVNRDAVIQSARLNDYIRVGVVNYVGGKYVWTKREGNIPTDFARPTKESFVNTFLRDAMFQDEVSLLHQQYKNITKQ